jgi:hypothetical protein
VLENHVLQKIFGPEEEEVVDGKIMKIFIICTLQLMLAG